MSNMRALTWLLIIIAHASIAQSVSGGEITSSIEARKKLEEQSWFKDYPVRNIGPNVQGGRVVDIEVNTNDTKQYFVAFASGGIFRTNNNGITFKPVFDNYGVMTIGDFALAPSDPNIIYVGTGEKNSSRSSYAGTGVYKSADGGATWTHCGLTLTQHIGRVLVHPTNPDIVWVAAIGALYSKSTERGIFKTSDGGKSWKKTLFVNDSTGVIDLAIDPAIPDHLLACSWERSRKAWNFKGHGTGSAIYSSTDGGMTWKKSANGFPSGESVGRIGIKFSKSNPKVVYALLDNQKEVEDKKTGTEQNDPDKLRAEDIQNLSLEDFSRLDDKKLEGFLRDNNYPKKYTAESVKRDVRERRYSPKQISDYIGYDANTKLFKTKIKGAEVYRSDDGGQSWKLTNSYDLDGMYYTYGYYFGELEVAPDNENLLYICGVPVLKSKDAGSTWNRIDTLKGIKNVHIDNHALWINPKDSKHLLLGNDGGLYQSYDEGATWKHVNNTTVGQFYTVNVDMETPYNVYGGLQDNGVLRGSSKSIPNETKNWDYLFWGDGMFVAPDPKNYKHIYAGYQFGNYFSIDLEKNKNQKITPQHDIGDKAYRWNWRSPLIVSKHNSEILYTAANKVFMSVNKGETWETISDDLTKNLPPGNVPFSTISALAESPLQFGTLFAGTDDGNVWMKTTSSPWVNIGNGLPSNKWISCIFPSAHDENTVFISLNGYRDDDFRTYLFMSVDSGRSWMSVSGNLPDAVANVIVQDPVDPDLLYCGLDNGTYASFDLGKTWHLLNGFTNAPAYDMLVHPRDNELVVATHGRSVFVMDVKPLQALKDKHIAKSIVAFNPEEVQYDSKWGVREYGWSKVKEPFVEIQYFVGKNSSALTAQIFDEHDNQIRQYELPASTGFHHFRWDLKSMPQNGKTKNQNSGYVQRGKYKVKLTSAGETSEAIVEVK